MEVVRVRWESSSKICHLGKLDARGRCIQETLESGQRGGCICSR